MFVDVAIKIHPKQHGSAANFMAFNRPIHSIKTPAIRQPTGTLFRQLKFSSECWTVNDEQFKITHDKTIILATHDVWTGVNFRSLSGAKNVFFLNKIHYENVVWKLPSTCGMRMALNASDIPITMWNEAATTATNACGNAVRKLFES